MPQLHSQNKTSSFLLVSHTGCILPLFIILNFFFGWIFLGLFKWLIVEALLILILVIKSLIIAKKIVSVSSGRGKIIDVKGEVIKEDKSKRLP